MQVLSVLGDVEDGVGDQLSRAVIGDVATAISWNYFDALGFVPLLRVKEVFGVKARAEGEDRVMLEEQEGIFGTVLDLGDYCKLLGESVLVGYPSEVEELQGR